MKYRREYHTRHVSATRRSLLAPLRKKISQFADNLYKEALHQQRVRDKILFPFKLMKKESRSCPFPAPPQPYFRQ